MNFIYKVSSTSNAHSKEKNSPSQDVGLVNKDGYERIGSLTLYIPEKIEIDRLLIKRPPGFSFSRDNFVYIIHLVTEIPSRKKDTIELINGFTPVNKKFLQKRIHGYKKYIDYLIVNGILDQRNIYSPGKFSMGLRISRRHESPLVPIEITKWTLIKSIIYKQHNTYNKEITSELTYLRNWFNDKIEVDYDSGVKFLDDLYNQERKNPEISYERLRYNSRLLPFLKLRDRKYDFYVDDTGYRLHTNITQMMSPLRRFIKYDGKKLCAIDLKNSQLFLSIGLLDEIVFERNNIKDLINNPNLLSYDNYPIMIVNLLREIKKKRDVKLFIKYVRKGKFYEYFGKLLIKRKLIEKCSKLILREEVKEIVFSSIYSPNSSIGYNEAMQLFKEVFPNVFRVYSLIKKGRKRNHPALSICLQRFEADLILRQTCGIISKKEPKIPLFTIHDSIITTKDNVGYVKKVLSKVLKDKTGVKPPLKIERWE